MTGSGSSMVPESLPASAPAVPPIPTIPPAPAVPPPPVPALPAPAPLLPPLPLIPGFDGAAFSSPLHAISRVQAVPSARASLLAIEGRPTRHDRLVPGRERGAVLHAEVVHLAIGVGEAVPTPVLVPGIRGRDEFVDFDVVAGDAEHHVHRTRGHSSGR